MMVLVVEEMCVHLYVYIYVYRRLWEEVRQKVALDYERLVFEVESNSILGCIAAWTPTVPSTTKTLFVGSV